MSLDKTHTIHGGTNGMSPARVESADGAAVPWTLLAISAADPASPPALPVIALRAMAELRGAASADAVVLVLQQGREPMVAGHLGLDRAGEGFAASLIGLDTPAHRLLDLDRPRRWGPDAEPLGEAGERLLRGDGYRWMVSLPIAGFTRLRGGVLLLFASSVPDATRVEEWWARAAHVAHAIEFDELRWRHDADRSLFSEIHAGLERRVQRGEERRRAMVHMLADLTKFNRRLSDQRKAMIHILADYEGDRRRMGRQTERLDASRRALLNILKDSHNSNLRLADSRKAMIHIMGDLRETTNEIQRREHELRDKQEQLVQAGKLATLGELTTGVAHELNNPLNNIGLAIGNVIDRLELGQNDRAPLLKELQAAMLQVRKATEIITHLRTFGRAAPVSLELVSLNDVAERSLELVQEQLRLREIEVVLDLSPEGPTVVGSPIQLEQVAINLLTNARDALSGQAVRRIVMSTRRLDAEAELTVEDTGPGVPAGLEQRVFDPFFTTKDVGSGTGLGLSITYGILREHGGSIRVDNVAGGGARFTVRLPHAAPETKRRGSR